MAEAPLEQVPLTQALPGGDQRRLGDRGPTFAAALGIELVGRLLVVQDTMWHSRSGPGLITIRARTLVAGASSYG